MGATPEKEFSSKRKLQFALFTFLFFLLLIIGVGEVITRIMTPPSPHFNKANPDKVLGWQSKPNYKYTTTLKDYIDTPYIVNYSTKRDGFRQFGNLTTTKPKVFIVGDSYTQSVEVSDDKTFFHHLQDSLDVEIFAYGQAGYGNLQHYMILEKYLEEIQPDLVVLQVCSNDFIDNYADLERACGYKVGLERPYLSLDGTIYYENPAHTWTSFLRKSKFIDLIFRKIEYSILKKEEIVGEKRIAEEKRSFHAFDQSVLVTERLIEKFKTKLNNNIPIIGFNADVYQPQNDEFKRIFTDQGIPFYDTPAFQVLHASNNGVCVRAKDGYHWNNEGQRRIAVELQKIIQPMLEGI